MQPTVSILIPVYNAQNTLARCVDSVLGQVYTDFELLLLDDGSTDGSPALCDAYAQKDSRVRVFHKPNSGVSDTRNLGLDKACGEYLQFMDSDDWITPDATGALVRAARENRCDLVVADFYRVVGERVARKGSMDSEGLLTREEYAACMMENPADYYYGVLWNKLYRRDLVISHKLHMDPAISWCEDFMFNLEYIRLASSFYVLQVPIYYYVKTKGSLVTSQGISVSNTIKMKLTVFEYYNRFFKTVLTEEEYEKSRGKVYRFLVDSAGDGVVSPAAKKLGRERLTVSRDCLRAEGALGELFRERKLLERFLETEALRSDLSLPEALVLLCSQTGAVFTNRRELADFLGLPAGVLSLALEKLSLRGLLWPVETHKEGKKQLMLDPTPEAEAVLRELTAARDASQKVRLSCLSEEEQVQYLALTDRVRQNVRSLL